ncbi:MAG TPA: class I SAM-dependent methyltransferase [Vicinamibacterales bacterium]|nr:class I SAM-dependent methyltransferase [Vicinamibacterales bacterium]
MMETLDDRLKRLQRERDEADRRYNDALTAVDRALPDAPPLAPLPPAVDDSQLEALNRSWNTIVSAPAGGAGWRGRLAGFIWRTVAPYLERQLTFNSQIIDHLNRGAAALRTAQQSAEEQRARLHEAFAAQRVFHSTIMQYLQQITAYVDTRDRDAAGGALVLNAALSGVAENVDKRWESLAARDQRRDAQTDRLAAAHEELRTMIGVSQQASIALKREVERLMASSAPPPAASVVSGPAADAPRDEAFRPLDSYKYVGFEDQFRGSRDAIRARLESYLPFFVGAADVVDVGCGRGEFLELLRGASIRARGIDLNHEMAEFCRANGLDVTEADAVGYLSSLPDASIGGLFAAQVVEHLQPAYLLRFLELAFLKIRPGGRLVLETLNPACWVAFFESYIRDITHVWPLHPETLKYLVLASGFTHADIEYRSPVPVDDRLQAIIAPVDADPVLAGVVDAINANTDKLNARMFTHLDYAVIGAR